MRERDEIWDALDAHFGPCRTKTEASMRGKAVKELREAGATPDEIAIAHRWCAANFSPFSEMALVKYFGRAQHEALEPAKDNVTAIRKLAGL
jgi:hypothetical protein